MAEGADLVRLFAEQAAYIFSENMTAEIGT